MPEESLDVLDENGKLSGRSERTTTVHQLGLWHRTAHVWLVTPEGKIVLQLRGPHKKQYANTWDISCAGHISSGEDVLVGAAREVEEEMGLKIPIEQFEKLGTIRRSVVFPKEKIINNEFQHIYLIEIPIVKKDLKFPKPEVGGVKIIPWSDLQTRVQQSDLTIVPHDEEYQMLFNVLKQRYPHAHPS